MKKYDPQDIEKKWPQNHSPSARVRGKQDYNPGAIESRWQQKWAEWGLYQAHDRSDKPKLYVLDMFPYPSGAGLHVGHTRIYTASDVLARYFRMRGYNVLHPMGWDAFGLPAENDAIKKKVNPNKLVPENIANFKRQMQSLGFSYDWSREFSTADSSYYQWTQWLFLQFFKMGLLYRKKVPINWCQQCKTGIANEEVLPNGTHERCGQPVVKREMPQWLFKITSYADRLLEDLEGLDWPRSILEMQRNWIGRSEGTEIDFPLDAGSWKLEAGKEAGNSKLDNSSFQHLASLQASSLEPPASIKVFTTRPDTIFGVTALVLAPEHPLIESLITSKDPSAAAPTAIGSRGEVRRYVLASKRKSELERAELVKEKTGVFTGLYAVNPAHQEKVPIWVADYVIGWYGGGAVMLVPAHDQRDYEFAKKYDLPVRAVVSPNSDEEHLPNHQRAFEGEGTLVDSGKFSGMTSTKARRRVTDWLQENGYGRWAVSYKMRDWVFSRQRYWGEPIPLVHCERCAKNGVSWWDTKPPKFPKPPNSSELVGWFPVSENELPVELPYAEKYEPAGTGESPLAAIKDWANVPCPFCGGSARRETDTMPNWAGSCWYFLRFAIGEVQPARFESPARKDFVSGGRSESGGSSSASGDSSNLKFKVQNLEKIWKDVFKPEITKWLPVDWYLGGAEHAVLHLLYARFWVKAMYDLGLVNFKEPFRRLRSVGMVQGEDGRKMSKSIGNVVNPDDVVGTFGADTLRLYEMFMGPFGQAISWDSQGVEGAYRFLKKVRTLSQNFSATPAIPTSLQRKLHRLIKKVGEDIETIKFNTAIAAMMEFIKEMSNIKCQMSNEEWGIFLRLLAPFAPHITEELWNAVGPSQGDGSVHLQPWPQYNYKLLEEDEITIIIQVDGRIRGRIRVKRNLAGADIRNLAEKSPNVKRFLRGRRIKETYLIADRLINFATESKTAKPS